jgi:TonB family protein
MLAALIGTGLWSMASPAVAADPGCNLHPIEATHTIPPYPPAARAQFEQGSVVLMVTVDAKGVPTAAELDKPSSFMRLNDAAKSWVMQTWRWEPLSAGCASGVRTFVKIDFTLTDDTSGTRPSLSIDVPDVDFPAGAQDRRESGNAIVIVYVDEKGTVLATRVAGSTTFNDLDAQAITLAKRHSFQAPSIDGKPVPGMFWIAVRFGMTVH